MIVALAAYLTATTATFAVMFAQTDLLDPAIEVGGTVGVVGASVFLLRWVMRVTKHQTETLQTENEKLRARIDQLETRLDSRTGTD